MLCVAEEQLRLERHTVGCMPPKKAMQCPQIRIILESVLTIDPNNMS